MEQATKGDTEMQRHSLGLTALLGVLAVPILAAAAGRVYQSNDEQRAKDKLAQTQADVREDRDALKAKIHDQREHLEADAEARQDKVEANAEREVEAIQAHSREQQAALDQAAKEKQQQLDERLNAAEEKVENAANEARNASAAEANAAGFREGVITSVNPAARVVTIREPDRVSGPLVTGGTSVVPLFVAEKVRVEQGGQAVSLRDVQVGDRVQLHLSGPSGQREVQRILIIERAALGQVR